MPPKPKTSNSKKLVAMVKAGVKRHAIDLHLSDDDAELTPSKRGTGPSAKKQKSVRSAKPPASPLSSPLSLPDEELNVKKELNEEVVAFSVCSDDEGSEVEEVQDGNEVNQLEDQASSTLGDSADDDKHSEADAFPKSVMLEDIQDDYLKEHGFYEELPVLQDPARVVRTSDGALDVAFAKYSLLADLFKHDNSRRQLLRGFAFDNFMCYVNTARAPLSVTIAVTEGKPDSRKLKLKVPAPDMGPRQAVCVSLGVVTDCRLADYDGLEVRYISVSLFGQEARRDFTYWGLKLDFNSIAGPMHSANGLKLTTVKKGLGTVYLNPNSLPSSPSKASVPRKGREIIKQPASPSKWFLYTYTSALAFEDDVPIYDGRATSTKKGFSFKPDDWKNLTSLPRYKRHGKLIDAPEDAIVTVGYTVYKYLFNSTWLLSANIQFVIVLADDKSF